MLNISYILIIFFKRFIVEGDKLYYWNYVSLFTEPPIARFSTRRKSVFAETYDPEEDEDDDGTKPVYPKSDEQRQQLADAVKNILLFRALEIEQMQEVLDAMFERKVTQDELVIKQGDDGDNFYVIQR